MTAGRRRIPAPEHRGPREPREPEPEPGPQPLPEVVWPAHFPTYAGRR